jgi:hypothetical protein
LILIHQNGQTLGHVPVFHGVDVDAFQYFGKMNYVRGVVNSPMRG